MTPKAKARIQIDQKLELADWFIQDLNQFNLSAAVGIAVREYPTDTGTADYVLFVNRDPFGVLEAKADNTILTFVDDQTERYASNALKWQVKEVSAFFVSTVPGQNICLPTMTSIIRSSPIRAVCKKSGCCLATSWMA